MGDEKDHVVVIFGDKRRHSDVLGPYSRVEAEEVKRRREAGESADIYVFPMQTEQDYTAPWIEGIE